MSVIGVFTDIGISKAIDAQNNEGFKIFPESFSISNVATPTLDPTITTPNAGEWYTGAISSRVVVDQNTVKIICTVPAGVLAPLATDVIREVYLFAKDSGNNDFLLAFGQPTVEINYDNQAQVTLELHVSLTNIDLSSNFVFTNTQATEVADHNTDPNAHPDLLSEVHKAGLFPEMGAVPFKYAGQQFDKKAEFDGVNATILVGGVTFSATFNGDELNAVDLVLDGIKDADTIRSDFNEANFPQTIEHDGVGTEVIAAQTVQFAGGTYLVDDQDMVYKAADGIYKQAIQNNLTESKYVGIAQRAGRCVVTQGLMAVTHGFAKDDLLYLSTLSAGKLTNVNSGRKVGLCVGDDVVFISGFAGEVLAGLSQAFDAVVSDTPGLNTYPTTELAFAALSTGQRLLIDKIDDIKTTLNTNSKELEIVFNGPSTGWRKFAGTQEQILIEFDSVPTQGTWRLEFDGQETPDLAWNADNTAIQAAFNLLAGHGGVIVTGSYGAGLTFTFQDQLNYGLITFLDAGQNEIQRFDFSNIPNDGTITFSLDLNPTLNFPWDDGAAELKNAFEALPNIQNINVTGSFASQFYQLEFQGGWLQDGVKPINDIAVDANILDLVGAPTIETHSTITQGKTPASNLFTGTTPIVISVSVPVEGEAIGPDRCIDMASNNVSMKGLGEIENFEEGIVLNGNVNIRVEMSFPNTTCPVLTGAGETGIAYQLEGSNGFAPDVYSVLRLLEHPTDGKRVVVTGVQRLLASGVVLSAELEGLLLKFDGAEIDFSDGNIYEKDGTTPLSGGFSMPAIGAGLYRWFSINLVQLSVNADNTSKAGLLINIALGEDADKDIAPKADYDKKPIGQVAVLGSAGVKEKIQIITTADTPLDSLHLETIILYDDIGSVGVWFDIDNTGAPIPALALAQNRQIAVTTISTDDDHNAVASQLGGTLDADSKFDTSIVNNKIDVESAIVGARTDATNGDTSFTINNLVQGIDIDPSGIDDISNKFIVQVPFFGVDSNAGTAEFDDKVTQSQLATELQNLETGGVAEVAPNTIYDTYDDDLKGTKIASEVINDELLLVENALTGSYEQKIEVNTKIKKGTGNSRMSFDMFRPSSDVVIPAPVANQLVFEMDTDVQSKFPDSTPVFWCKEITQNSSEAYIFLSEGGINDYIEKFNVFSTAYDSLTDRTTITLDTPNNQDFTFGYTQSEYGFHIRVIPCDIDWQMTVDDGLNYFSSKIVDIATTNVERFSADYNKEVLVPEQLYDTNAGGINTTERDKLGSLESVISKSSPSGQYILMRCLFDTGGGSAQHPQFFWSRDFGNSYHIMDKELFTMDMVSNGTVAHLHGSSPYFMKPSMIQVLDDGKFVIQVTHTGTTGYWTNFAGYGDLSVDPVFIEGAPSLLSGVDGYVTGLLPVPMPYGGSQAGGSAVHIYSMNIAMSDDGKVMHQTFWGNSSGDYIFRRNEFGKLCRTTYMAGHVNTGGTPQAVFAVGSGRHHKYIWMPKGATSLAMLETDEQYAVNQAISGAVSLPYSNYDFPSLSNDWGFEFYTLPIKTYIDFLMNDTYVIALFRDNNYTQTLNYVYMEHHYNNYTLETKWEKPDDLDGWTIIDGNPDGAPHYVSDFTVGNDGWVFLENEGRGTDENLVNRNDVVRVDMQYQMPDYSLVFNHRTNSGAGAGIFPDDNAVANASPVAAKVINGLTSGVTYKLSMITKELQGAGNFCMDIFEGNDVSSRNAVGALPNLASVNTNTTTKVEVTFVAPVGGSVVLAGYNCNSSGHYAVSNIVVADYTSGVLSGQVYNASDKVFFENQGTGGEPYFGRTIVTIPNKEYYVQFSVTELNGAASFRMTAIDGTHLTSAVLSDAETPLGDINITVSRGAGFVFTALSDTTTLYAKCFGATAGDYSLQHVTIRPKPVWSATKQLTDFDNDPSHYNGTDYNSESSWLYSQGSRIRTGNNDKHIFFAMDCGSGTINNNAHPYIFEVKDITQNIGQLSPASTNTYNTATGFGYNLTSGSKKAQTYDFSGGGLINIYNEDFIGGGLEGWSEVTNSHASNSVTNVGAKLRVSWVAGDQPYVHYPITGLTPATTYQVDVDLTKLSGAGGSFYGIRAHDGGVVVPSNITALGALTILGDEFTVGSGHVTLLFTPTGTDVMLAIVHGGGYSQWDIDDVIVVKPASVGPMVNAKTFGVKYYLSSNAHTISGSDSLSKDNHVIVNLKSGSVPDSGSILQSWTTPMRDIALNDAGGRQSYYELSEAVQTTMQTQEQFHLEFITSWGIDYMNGASIYTTVNIKAQTAKPMIYGEVFRYDNDNTYIVDVANYSLSIGWFDHYVHEMYHTGRENTVHNTISYEYSGLTQIEKIGNKIVMSSRKSIHQSVVEHSLDHGGKLFKQEMVIDGSNTSSFDSVTPLKMIGYNGKGNKIQLDPNLFFNISLGNPELIHRERYDRSIIAAGATNVAFTDYSGWGTDAASFTGTNLRIKDDARFQSGKKLEFIIGDQITYSNSRNREQQIGNAGDGNFACEVEFEPTVAVNPSYNNGPILSMAVHSTVQPAADQVDCDIWFGVDKYMRPCIRSGNTKASRGRGTTEGSQEGLNTISNTVLIVGEYYRIRYWKDDDGFFKISTCTGAALTAGPEGTPIFTEVTYEHQNNNGTYQKLVEDKFEINLDGWSTLGDENIANTITKVGSVASVILDNDFNIDIESFQENTDSHINNDISHTGTRLNSTYVTATDPMAHKLLTGLTNGIKYRVDVEITKISGANMTCYVRDGSPVVPATSATILGLPVLGNSAGVGQVSFEFIATDISEIISFEHSSGFGQFEIDNLVVTQVAVGAAMQIDWNVGVFGTDDPIAYKILNVTPDLWYIWNPAMREVSGTSNFSYEIYEGNDVSTRANLLAQNRLAFNSDGGQTWQNPISQFKAIGNQVTLVIRASSAAFGVIDIQKITVREHGFNIFRGAQELMVGHNTSPNEHSVGNYGYIKAINHSNQFAYDGFYPQGPLIGHNMLPNGDITAMRLVDSEDLTALGTNYDLVVIKDKTPHVDTKDVDVYYEHEFVTEGKKLGHKKIQNRGDIEVKTKEQGFKTQFDKQTS